jgi:hypothetical protein
LPTPTAPNLWFPNPLARARTLVPQHARLSPAEPGVFEWRTIPFESGWDGLRTGGDAAGCLNAFVRLADAPDDAFPPFALRWGVIGFLGDAADPPQGGWWAFDSDDPTGNWACESIATWRRLAVEVKNFLDRALELRALEGERAERSHAFDLPIELRWVDLAQDVTSRLQEAGCRPALSWYSSPPALRMELKLGDPSFGPYLGAPRGSLYALVMAQLAAALLADSVLRCDRCGEPFTPEDPDARRPRADRRKFCGDWCRQEQRRERQKLRARRHYTPKGVRGGTVLDCARCGEPFTLDSPEASRRGRRRKFCNDSCRKEQARENKKLWKRSHYIPKGDTP